MAKATYENTYEKMLELDRLERNKLSQLNKNELVDKIMELESKIVVLNFQIDLLHDEVDLAYGTAEEQYE